VAGTFDYVVVGAGSAGAAVAHRLSADPELRVLLLEAGAEDERPEIHRVDSASVLALLTSEWSPQIDWGYATEPEPGLNSRTVPIARGKVLGGSSSVNALMWVRGARAGYDGAVANYRQIVLAAFQQVEDNIVALRVLDSELGHDQRASAEADEAETLATMQYQAGTTDYTAVVVAQNTALAARRAAVQAARDRQVALVDLVSALGGGWTAQQLASK